MFLFQLLVQQTVSKWQGQTRWAEHPSSSDCPVQLKSQLPQAAPTSRKCRRSDDVFEFLRNPEENTQRRHTEAMEKLQKAQDDFEPDDPADPKNIAAMWRFFISFFLWSSQNVFAQLLNCSFKTVFSFRITLKLYFTGQQLFLFMFLIYGRFFFLIWQFLLLLVAHFVFSFLLILLFFFFSFCIYN